jgi:hypothetical protein
MRPARLLALPIAVLAVATCAPASIAATTPTLNPVASAPVPGANAQGIIMSDGRICNPRWGC